MLSKSLSTLWCASLVSLHGIATTKCAPYQLQMGLLPLPRTQMTIVLVAKGLVLGVLTLLTFKNRGHLGSIYSRYIYL